MAFSLFSHKRSVGLDINDHSIEVVELVQSGDAPALSSLNRIMLPAGIIRKGEILQRDELIKQIKILFEKAQPQAIKLDSFISAIPERHVYLYQFTLTLPSSEETSHSFIDDKVANEAKSNMPYDELVYSYSIRKDDKDENIRHVLVAGTDATVLSQWNDFFESLEVTIPHYDIEPLSLLRGLRVSKLDLKGAGCVIDIGFTTTLFSIYTIHGIYYAHSVPYAGHDITKAIADSLSVSYEEAEKLKRTHGLSDPKHPIYSVVHPALKKIVDEILSLLKFVEKKLEISFEEIRLVGGTAHMNGIVDYFANATGLTISLGAPRVIEGQGKLYYVKAVGLAMRGLYKVWDERDPSFPSAHVGVQDKNNANNNYKNDKKFNLSFLKKNEDQ